jgi:hypothetical protein
MSELHAETMDFNLDRLDSCRPARLTSEPLEAVRHLRVSIDNPETSTNEGLDFERCSALHNAIVEHAWQAEGCDLADLPTTTWWRRSDHTPRLVEFGKSSPRALLDVWSEHLA